MEARPCQPDRCPECGAADASAGHLPAVPDPPGHRRPGPRPLRPSSPGGPTGSAGDTAARRRPGRRSPPRSARSPASCSATPAPGEPPGPVVRPHADGDDRRARSATGSTARSPAAAWAPSSRAATPTSAATWPSRSSATTSATTPTWSAGSSRRRRSAASSSTPGSCRSTSWAPSPTAGPTSP